MRSVSVPYTVADNKLNMQTLQWPSYCACCGQPGPNGTAPLQHAARKSTSVVDTGVSRTTTTSGYYLHWDVPCCDVCLAHQKRSLNPTPVALLFVAGFVAMFAVGYGLFSMGLSEDALAIGGYVAFIALMGLGGWYVYRQVGAKRMAEARAMMGPKCTNPGPAAFATSNLETITFSFPNDPFAEAFARMNRLQA